MIERPEVAPETVAALRAVCLALPEAYEEPAWVGTRWRIRTRTFAHVVVIDDGSPPAYARAAGSDGPLTVVTFRGAGQEAGRAAVVRAAVLRAALVGGHGRDDPRRDHRLGRGPASS